MGLDGRETPLPVRRPTPLSRRQREVLAYVRATYPVRPLDVGRVMHAGRERACLECVAFGRHCRHASSDGYDALRRLERRGLVVRERRGAWSPTVAVEDWPGP
jgi:hypothetical protein